MEVGLGRERRAPRIDHDQARAALARGFDDRDQMDAGRRWIDAPQHDQAGVAVILERNAGHLAVERGGRCAGRGRAHRARQTRSSDAGEQARVGGALREEPVRSAVAERQDRLAAGALTHALDPLDDQVERVVPPDPFEDAVTLATDAALWMEQALRAVYVSRKTSHLAAQETLGEGVVVRAVELDDDSVLDGGVD